jgi:hypothetical protein
MFGGRPFRDLVRTQLDLFTTDEAALLEEAREAEKAWQQAGREDAEEVYGDWQLVADAIAERLLDIRETYAAALDGPAAVGYRGAFDRETKRRYPRFAWLLDDDTGGSPRI